MHIDFNTLTLVAQNLIKYFMVKDLEWLTIWYNREPADNDLNGWGMTGSEMLRLCQIVIRHKTGAAPIANLPTKAAPKPFVTLAPEPFAVQSVGDTLAKLITELEAADEAIQNARGKANAIAFKFAEYRATLSK